MTVTCLSGEFGRTPDNGLRAGGQSYGRDHNAKAMTMWFAGGGTKAGHIIGATDDLGAEAVTCVHHIRDVHVTLLHLLGLDDNRLTGTVRPTIVTRGAEAPPPWDTRSIGIQGARASARE